MSVDVFCLLIYYTAKQLLKLRPNVYFLCLATFTESYPVLFRYFAGTNGLYFIQDLV